MIIVKHMSEPTYEDKDLWERLHTAPERCIKERVTAEGNNGEADFDSVMLEMSKGRRVLDVGTGDGRFALKIAQHAKEVVGVDFSEKAIALALENLAKSRKQNVQFQLADAHNLPFPEGSFNIVLSRRGPVTDDYQTLSEAYRVLKQGGYLLEITIGEEDKKNIKQVFNRGQLFNIRERVALAKRKMLEKVGFKDVDIREYFAKEYYETLEDLIIRLKSAPIILDFDQEKDCEKLKELERLYQTAKGIETNSHRVTIIAKK